MKQSKRIGARALSWSLPAVLALLAAPAWSAPLSLEDAEAMALREDPSVRQVEARSDALEEQAVAAGQLPDPMLKLGAVALPTDTFELGQEAMTQLQVGVTQKFPRGRSRDLAARQFRLRAGGMDDMALDRSYQVQQAVREQYIEVQLQQRLAGINREAIQAFADLADITQDYYGTGRGQQQDVLRASVELAKVQERGQRIEQMGQQARAQLAAWIGEAAYREVPADWADLAPLPEESILLEQLAQHPRIRALEQGIAAADAGVELARQGYRPEFALDVTYGDRRGTPPGASSSRPDLFSVMLVMDLPLFTAKRQDRVVASRVAESSSATYARDDEYRRLRSQASNHLASLRSERDRIGTYESVLLPEASFNADATFEAYQSSVEDLTTLMRARITEFELQLEFARLQADALKSQARLLYLEGAGR